MQAICVKEPGGPEKLYIGQVPKPKPKDGEVLIKICATALNRADVLQVRPFTDLTLKHKKILFK